jgi:dTDP-4-dehydrorhamnose 3,5-epimerase
MKFIETKLKGAYLIEPDLIRDNRGFFARSWCQKEFTDNGLNPNLVQCNISFNHNQGTLRGMHYQIAPYEEAKVVRCTAGAIYDVIVDLRPDSETFKQWVALELTAANHQALYIPVGMAHGFQTLVDNSEVLYQMSEFYHPDSARGLRWDDRVLGIAWPTESPSVISERDLSYSDFDL